MLTLEEIIENQRKNSATWLDRMTSNENTVHFSSNFHYYHLLLGISALAQAKTSLAKMNFFVCGLVDEYGVNNQNRRYRFLDYDMPAICVALLSDNNDQINRYSKLRYTSNDLVELSMDEMVERGETAIWCNTIQFFMAEDFEGVERNLNIIETKTLPKLPKKEELLKIDYEFYKALLKKDKEKCEELLAELVSPKIHKKRNDNPVLSQYVSQPALGYAKLAWRLGIEVEIDSPLVPKEILPVEPLEHYEIPYDFLREM